VRVVVDGCMSNSQMSNICIEVKNLRAISKPVQREKKNKVKQRETDKT